ncbi:MAG: hypothetical protein CVT95_12860 [Bacteroidetes bacterium HGW-Bacteroidetes-12]|nr:MAG: hypothetical protein CVT95_12860 [Bacteroidetes bacterium HGW-Bacteroidetes-12]
MKKQFSILLILLLGLTNYSYGQWNAKGTSSDFGISWGGFVKADYMYDTRQNVTAREGHFLLFPSLANMEGGKDINSEPNFNILAVQTRLTGKIHGPDFFGMKTSGVIEGAFFGQSDSNINGFRLRHAFVQLSNDKVDIIMGQYWNPLFVTAVYPGTYSFNTGVPFQPFSRNPQIRLTTKGKIRFIGVVFSERDFASRGPGAPAGSSTFLRNSGLPQFHTQLQFGGKEFLGGFGLNLKTLRPELGGGTITNKVLISYMKATLGKATFKLEGIYGENMSDVLSISGLAHDQNGGYTANKTLSVWSEIEGKGKSMEWGIFAGYSKNNGFNDPVGGDIYGLAPTMDHAFRVSPRIGWFSGNMTIGTEFEYTSAQYGALAANKMDIDTRGIDSVSNFRVLVSAIYGF